MACRVATVKPEHGEGEDGKTNQLNDDDLAEFVKLQNTSANSRSAAVTFSRN